MSTDGGDRDRDRAPRSAISQYFPTAESGASLGPRLEGLRKDVHADFERACRHLRRRARVHDPGNTDVLNYKCAACRESCLNPVDSVMATGKQRLCVSCEASCLVTGSTKYRNYLRTLETAPSRLAEGVRTVPAYSLKGDL